MSGINLSEMMIRDDFGSLDLCHCQTGRQSRIQFGNWTGLLWTDELAARLLNADSERKPPRKERVGRGLVGGELGRQWLMDERP